MRWRGGRAGWLRRRVCEHQPLLTPPTAHLILPPPPPSPPPTHTPSGTCEDMLRDVNAGVAWALANAHHYGGGGEGGAFLVGQSAGGQLAALALLAQVCMGCV